ncbi:BTAD domain-containing putative transcriptional regulator [Streptomyces sp. NPDC058256]|uniref:BTAD domain-containing putative transcriptional regulator n=1 Tax=Streptomyces sp. NPDC058256 TaxID=3346408 RepID=UPI0036E0D20D
MRLRRRARYRPGSGQRDDLTIAPVVRALRIAHDQAVVPAEDTDEASTSAEAPPTSAEIAARSRTEEFAQSLAPVEGRILGIRDGQALAWDLAHTRGLGLVGPGALAAIRALLVAHIAERDRSVDILIPAAEAQVLFGESIVRRPRPSHLRVVDDLEAALGILEAELLTRTRTTTEDGIGLTAGQEFLSELVLVATPAVHAERRLQAILDNGSVFGVAGVLLGQWRSGGTARVRQDGTVAAASPSVTETLTATRLFTLPATDGRALLDLLLDAEPALRSSPSRGGATGVAPGVASKAPHSERAPGIDNSAQAKQPRRRAQEPTNVREQPTPGDFSDSTASDDAEHHEHAPTEPAPDGRPSPTTARTMQVPDTPSAPHGLADGSPDSLRRPLPSPVTETPVRSEDDGEYEAARPTHASSPPLKLTVLGRMHLTHHQTDGGEHADLSAVLAPKHREVLAFLAVHRDGVRREALANAIWPDAPKDRPYNSFHATLSQLRRALRTATHGAVGDLTVLVDGHYALDRDQISVDLWQLWDALRLNRHASDDGQRRVAIERVVELYSGDLAAGIGVEWLEGPRESLRRDVLDAVSALVRILRGSEPDQALALLEHVRTLDPYNEAIYRDIARFQSHLGQQDAIARTLTLLTITLAEIDEQPSPETMALYDFLQRPRAGNRRGIGRGSG